MEEEKVAAVLLVGGLKMDIHIHFIYILMGVCIDLLFIIYF